MNLIGEINNRQVLKNRTPKRQEIGKCVRQTAFFHTVGSGFVSLFILIFLRGSCYTRMFLSIKSLLMLSYSRLCVGGAILIKATFSPFELRRLKAGLLSVYGVKNRRKNGRHEYLKQTPVKVKSEKVERF